MNVRVVWPKLLISQYLIKVSFSSEAKHCALLSWFSWPPKPPSLAPGQAIDQYSWSDPDFIRNMMVIAT